VFVQIEQQFQQSANNVEGKVCTRLRQGPNKSRTKAKAITKANKRGGGWKVGGNGKRQLGVVLGGGRWISLSQTWAKKIKRKFQIKLI